MRGSSKPLDLTGWMHCLFLTPLEFACKFFGLDERHWPITHNVGLACMRSSQSDSSGFQEYNVGR
ncbi:Uncharacterized protein BM_BM1268 [Brugia malayi]|uniref:Bm1268, isoform b n=1 Tax=Brugia malayi TaxID=6279 RepID=A0A0J9XTA7_BRUMA|nr:Uncharacterized protein BM_BM1268 [Brugia malayi]CDP94660.1 Bm1268, isoform b [Brugia malayi]VIO86842.1 Uncharacterized protein BM_BM1268 [Brugia malayi]